jgi:hypothetical protein
MTTADHVEVQRVTRIRLRTTAGCALVLALLAASAWARSAQEVRFGPASALGQGTVRTYLIVDGSGKPAELGVAISEVAMATVPDLSTKPPMEAFLSMDLEVPKPTPPPFKLVGFFWRPLGHPPAHIYDVPHFEFHFYLIDEVPLDDADPTGWKAAEALIGFIEDAPPDMAEHHDAYLRAGRL